MNAVRSHWQKKAQDQLAGRKIVTARYLTDQEISVLGWHGSSLVLELDNGLLLYASADDEGNGPGAIHGITKNNRSTGFPVTP